LERACGLLSQDNEAARFVIIQKVCSTWLDRQRWRVDRIVGVYENMIITS